MSLIPFPSAKVGLPDGMENGTGVTCESELEKFIQGFNLLEEPLEQTIINIKPDAIVSDSFYPWSFDAAARHGIPRLVFKGEGVMARCISEMYLQCVDSLSADVDTLIIPGLPHCFEFCRAQIMGPENDRLAFPLVKASKLADAKSYGEIFNSFLDLEQDYVAHWHNVIGRRAWLVGPLALGNEESIKESYREGDTLHFSCKELLNWLDARHPNSVLYISFGTLIKFSTAQLKEVVVALEKCHQDFILVAKGLIVEVLKVGVCLGAKGYGAVMEQKPLIHAEVIKSAVDRLMGGGKEAEEMRLRAKELKEKARTAVQEVAERFSCLLRFLPFSRASCDRISTFF
ncbi:Glycosyltransferase [Rhynchospora pubera]|uniref:Glycosyltransferase n=1 Tax=Rhynchospora pubera TaxID=906938 RepID=A0AAV8GUP6_9POAL|nr:Glycosyltransferase [Rhynchospora pubera]